MADKFDKFESWGIVELFGHQQIAGKISEATIGGCSFVRVDVPQTPPLTDTNDEWRYTRYFGQGAIYALNPTSEAVARIKARTCQEPPFAYDVNHHAVARAVEERMKSIASPKQETDSERQYRADRFADEQRDDGRDENIDDGDHVEDGRPF